MLRSAEAPGLELVAAGPGVRRKQGCRAVQGSLPLFLQCTTWEALLAAP